MRSVLNNQKHISTLFNNLDRQDVERKEDTIEYREGILDKVGSAARKTPTRAEMDEVRSKKRNKKADLKQAREEAEEAEDDFRIEYVAAQRKMGATNDRKKGSCFGKKVP